jgi:nucleoside-diphosphate-sugar epimerase
VVKHDDKLLPDLEYIFDHTHPFWIRLKDKTVFITGGTGFFGIWLLKSLLFANNKLQLNAKIVVLTRSSQRFLNKFPELVGIKELHFVDGDVKDFAHPSFQVHYIIHAAAETSSKLNIEEPLAMLDTIVQGTRHVLNYAVACKADGVLFISSGAIYGKQPSEITHIAEDFCGAPFTNDIGSAYGEGKRMAELLCTFYHKQYALNIKIARCFAFIGPYLPLDGSFAIGNFIKDILDEKDITVKGDGRPVRSYMYVADLCIWLWTMLFNGNNVYPYNVGSEEAYTLAQIASLVAQNNGSKVIIQDGNTLSLSATSRYVPSIERARKDLDLQVGIDLKNAIKKTIEYYRTVS